MKKDIIPVAGNSVDKRRPILTVSPIERQKKIKELKNPQPLDDEFKYSEQEVASMINEVTSKLKLEQEEELNKLKKEIDKKNKKILELNKQIKTSE